MTEPANTGDSNAGRPNSDAAEKATNLDSKGAPLA